LQNKITPFSAVDKPFSREMDEEPYTTDLCCPNVHLFEGKATKTI